MKNKVIKLLTKWGYNEETVLEMVEENFDTAIRCYPDSKASQLADFIASV
tara:strand:+ start:113 stop:262 length:150 start_codon:yes stop_codon:yes gene_type:complete